MPRVPRRSNSERTRYTSNAAARMDRIWTIGYVRSVSWKRSFDLNSLRPKYRIYRHSDAQRGSILQRVGGGGERSCGARQVCAGRNQAFLVAVIVTMLPSLRPEIDNPAARSSAVTHWAGSRSFL
jgi:hypothetical protein